jgi:hypothetical protein
LKRREKMRKKKVIYLEDLIMENKKKILSDEHALKRIEEKIDKKHIEISSKLENNNQN